MTSRRFNMNQNIPLSSVDVINDGDIIEETRHDDDTPYINEETAIVILTICCLLLFTLLGITVVGLIAITSNNEPPNTLEPTVEPTSQPTFGPTPLPTEAIPTPEPTDSPALDPTPQPTDSPTSTPTSPQPTSAPTNQPTPHPTEQPTFSPTEPPIVPVPPGDGKCCVAEGSEICAINTEPVCIGEDFRNLWLSPFTVPLRFSSRFLLGCMLSSYWWVSDYGLSRMLRFGRRDDTRTIVFHKLYRGIRKLLF